MSTGTDTLTNALSPLLQARGLDLVDVELQGAQLTVFVDREGGINLDELGEATREVSAALDDIDPFPGRYTLSVSSPGLERRLRTPEHFARAVGEKITVRGDGGTAFPRPRAMAPLPGQLRRESRRDTLRPTQPLYPRTGR